MYDLRNEPEIFDCDKKKPQIMDSDNYVQNLHTAVGYASRCWDKNGTFDTHSALRIVNELCAYVRLISERRLSADTGEISNGSPLIINITP